MSDPKPNLELNKELESTSHGADTKGALARGTLSNSDPDVVRKVQQARSKRRTKEHVQQKQSRINSVPDREQLQREVHQTSHKKAAKVDASDLQNVQVSSYSLSKEDRQSIKTMNRVTQYTDKDLNHGTRPDKHLASGADLNSASSSVEFSRSNLSTSRQAPYRDTILDILVKKIVALLEAIERLLGIRGPARGKAGEGRVAKKRFGLAKRKAEADQELKQEQRRIQAFQKRLKRFRYASEGSDESVRPRSSENP